LSGDEQEDRGSTIEREREYPTPPSQWRVVKGGNAWDIMAGDTHIAGITSEFAAQAIIAAHNLSGAETEPMAAEPEPEKVSSPSQLAIEAAEKICRETLEEQANNPAWSKAELWGIERDIIPMLRVRIQAAIDEATLKAEIRMMRPSQWRVVKGGNAWDIMAGDTHIAGITSEFAAQAIVAVHNAESRPAQDWPPISRPHRL